MRTTVQLTHLRDKREAPMATRLSWLVAVALVIGFTGCGGDGDDVNYGDAPKKCNQLVDLICVRAIGCFNDGTTQAECVAAVKTELPCAGADAVSDTYDACLSDLSASPCSVLAANQTLNLPATCNAVILFRQ
jgi:hypothetical protein